MAIKCWSSKIRGVARITHSSHSRRSVLAAPFLAMPAVFAGLPSLATAAEGGFELFPIHRRARGGGESVRSSTVDLALRYAQCLPHVIELDRHQPEQLLTFTQYLQKTVSPQRVQSARRALYDNWGLLDAVGELRCRSAVCRCLWGMESDFGKITGNYLVVALACHARVRRAAWLLFSRRADLGSPDHRPGEYRARQYEWLVGGRDGSMPVHAVDLFALCGRL